MSECTQNCYNCKNSFCSNIPESVRKQLCSLSKSVTFKPKKDQLINLDGGRVTIVESGALMTIRMLENERYQGIDILGSGDMLGIAELFNANDGCEMIVVRPLAQTKICMVPIADVERLMSAEPVFFQHVYSMLAKRFHRALSNLTICVSGSSKERTRHFMELAQEYGRLNLTHEDLATLSGLNRVTVTNCLKTI
ncbi:MAG: Crp/Fnr family transcriptional regulator [Oscillospiraceae bacterium]